MKQRGVLSDKERIAGIVMDCAKQSKNLTELDQQLKANHIETYHRNTILTGIWVGQRKFRLTTLGVGREHLRKLTREEERLRELKKGNSKENLEK